MFSFGTRREKSNLLGFAPGAYASVAHEAYTDAKLERLRANVQRPVLLVVSIREGSDLGSFVDFQSGQAQQRECHWL